MDIRAPAPGGLRLVEAFLRTRLSVTSPETLAGWLRTHRFPTGPLDTDDVATAAGVREAIRSLAAANNALPPPADAAATLDALLLLHRVVPTLATPTLPAVPVVGWRSARPDVDAGLGAALAAVLGGVVTAVADGTWPRFKACAADDCRYAFYDHTRNRSTRWCDVAGCGVNTRMRAYRTRRTHP